MTDEKLKRYVCGCNEPFSFDEQGYAICAGMQETENGEFVKVSELKEKIENANRGVMKKAFDYAHSEKDFYKGVKDKGYPISVLVEPYREGFEQLQRELLSALGVGEREKKEKKE